jgi:MFS family permease
LKLPPGFGRDVRLLTASMFTLRIVMGFLAVVRALYFAYLGYTAVEIGLLLSVATGVSAIKNVTFGYLCDRYGRKPFLVLGSVFAALRMVIFAVSTDFWMLALGQGFGALGEGVGAGQPVVSGYITDKVEPGDRPGVYSGIAITNSLAATVGSALAGMPVYLQASYGLELVQAHQVLWWACAVTSALSLIMVFPLGESSLRVEASAKPEAPRRINWGAIARFSLIRGTNGLAWGLADSLTPLYLFYRFGVGSDALGPVYAFARLLSVFSYIILPRIVDRFGDIHTLIASRVASAGLTLAFALAGSYPVAVGLLVVNRLVTLFSMPIRQTFASGFVDPEETATAIGVSSFARMGAQTAAPTLAGYMFEALSLSAPFIVGASLMVVNGALYWVLFRPGEDQAALAEAVRA